MARMSGRRHEAIYTWSLFPRNIPCHLFQELKSYFVIFLSFTMDGVRNCDTTVTLTRVKI